MKGCWRFLQDMDYNIFGMVSVKKVILWFFLLVVIIMGIDLVRILSYDKIPSLPETSVSTKEDEIYAALCRGAGNIDWNELNATLHFIEKQYDTADFKLVNLIRILYEYNDSVPLDVSGRIESTLLNFRYWMDEPGENSMCYWSENHQILFSSALYLVGNLYPDRVFKHSQLTGSEQREKARKLILDWLSLRWVYGFSEFYSGVYYIEDIAALLNLIDHSGDEEIIQKSKIVLDLLFYDIATQHTQGMTVSVSGRAYESNRKGGSRENLRGIADFLINRKEIPPGMVFSLNRTDNYTIPSVFFEIANDTNHVVIKQSNGIDVGELKNEHLIGLDTKSIQTQWGMEAFTNPDVILNSLRYIKRNNLFSNHFLQHFRYLDFTLLSTFSLQKPLSKLLNPVTNGKAIQRGNTYTYRTKDYSLYAVQHYHPGDYADQHHVAGMNVGNNFSIFHTHPAALPQEAIHSPNYWVGYGRLPHVAQEGNVNLAIYHLPNKKGFLEKRLIDYTHAYFPVALFDSIRLSDHYLFGKKGNVYCALIGYNNFSFVSGEDVIQRGRNIFWILEAGSRAEDGSFASFQKRILDNKVSFDEDKLMLTYWSRNKEYRLSYCHGFSFAGKPVLTDYPRYDAPYVSAERKPQELLFEFKRKKLYLNFSACRRELIN